MEIKKYYIMVLATLVLLPNVSHASSPVLALSDIKLSGFMSAVGSKSNRETPYHRFAQINEDIDFGRETMLGLQIDARLTDQIVFTTQLLADRDPDNYSLQADWIYAKYSFNKTTNLKVGRLRTPIFMFSDFIEVGLTYPWIRPPTEVYGLIPLNVFNGLDFVMNIPVSDYNLHLQGVYGNTQLDTTLLSLSGDATISTYDSGGVNVMLTTDNHIFRVGYVVSKLDIFDNGVALFQQFGVLALSPQIIEGADLDFIAIGSDLKFGNVNIVMEHGIRKISHTAINQEQSGSYVMVQYSLDRLHPHVTYAIADSIGVSSINAEQNSVTIGAKYELSFNTVLKIDYIRIKLLNGTQGFFLTLPDEDSANIVSVALDLVF